METIDIEFIDARRKIFKNLQDNEWEVIINIRNELQYIAHKYNLKWNNNLFYQFIKIFTDKWRHQSAVARNWYPNIIWKVRQDDDDNEEENEIIIDNEDETIVENVDENSNTILMYSDYNLWFDFITWMQSWNELCGTNILDYATTVDFDYFFTKLFYFENKNQIQIVREIK